MEKPTGWKLTQITGVSQFERLPCALRVMGKLIATTSHKHSGMFGCGCLAGDIVALAYVESTVPCKVDERQL